MYIYIYIIFDRFESMFIWFRFYFLVILQGGPPGSVNGAERHQRYVADRSCLSWRACAVLPAQLFARNGAVDAACCALLNFRRRAFRKAFRKVFWKPALVGRNKNTPDSTTLTLRTRFKKLNRPQNNKLHFSDSGNLNFLNSFGVNL